MKRREKRELFRQLRQSRCNGIWNGLAWDCRPGTGVASSLSTGNGTAGLMSRREGMGMGKACSLVGQLVLSCYCSRVARSGGVGGVAAKSYLQREKKKLPFNWPREMFALLFFLLLLLLLHRWHVLPHPVPAFTRGRLFNEKANPFPSPVD